MDKIIIISMSNKLSPTEVITLRETGLISFDTLRHLNAKKQYYFGAEEGAIRKALLGLAISERDYLTKLIQEANDELDKLPAVPVKTFVSYFTQTMNTHEIDLQEKVLEVYTLTQQDAKATSIKNGKRIVRTRVTFNGNPEMTVNRQFVDRLRLHSAWLRELANVVIKCVSNTSDDLIVNYDREFSRGKVIDRALSSLSPAPGIRTIREWSTDAQKML